MTPADPSCPFAARRWRGARPRSLVNRNTLLTAAEWIDGVKTGYTSAAGECLITAATREGRTLVSVVLGLVSLWTEQPAAGIRLV